MNPPVPTPVEVEAMIAKVPAKMSGKIQCGPCKVDVVIGKNGLMFCPNETCKNSEANYK